MAVHEVVSKIFMHEGACNTYYIDDDKKILIDAGVDFKGAVDTLILTHFHPDHALFAQSIKERAGCRVLIGTSDANPLSIISDVWPSWGGQTVNKVTPDGFLAEGNVISTGSYNFTVIEVPGHTIGSIALWEPLKKILFTGDTLFAHGFVGRVDFPYSDEQSITDSVARLNELNPEVILPGHGDIIPKVL